MSTTPIPDQTARQSWMSLLARSPREAVERAVKTLPDQVAYGFLRRPETGLCMVRGRVGGTGPAFNLGEMTLTRCVVRTSDGRIGYGYVAGRDTLHAELAAYCDALLQDEAARAGLDALLLAPLRGELARRQARRTAETEATRVEFFTMVRGEDPNG